MAKKTEEELLTTLKYRDSINKVKNRVFCDLGSGKDITSFKNWEVDGKHNSKTLISELANYHYWDDANKVNEVKDNISRTNFKAYFEDKDFPQDDEILSVKFVPTDNGDKLYLHITVAPKRKFYFDLLTTEIKENPFILELKNKDNEKVDEIRMYVSTRSHTLLDPIEFIRGIKMFDADILTYELEFDFVID